MRDEPLALGEQAPFGEQPAPDALLHSSDELRVLVPDLRVEREQLVDPRLLDAGPEEVVEEASRALRPQRHARAAGQVRLAREDVDPEVRPDEVELAVWDLAVGEERAAVRTERPELAGRQARGLEPVGVRGDVDLRREARV